MSNIQSRYEHVPLVVPDKPNKPSDTPSFEHHVVFEWPPGSKFNSFVMRDQLIAHMLTTTLRKHVDYRFSKPENFWPDGVNKKIGAYGFYGNVPAHTRFRVRFHSREQAMLLRLSFVPQ